MGNKDVCKVGFALFEFCILLKGELWWVQKIDFYLHFCNAWSLKNMSPKYH